MGQSQIGKGLRRIIPNFEIVLTGLLVIFLVKSWALSSRPSGDFLRAATFA